MQFDTFFCGSQFFLPFWSKHHQSRNPLEKCFALSMVIIVFLFIFRSMFRLDNRTVVWTYLPEISQVWWWGARIHDCCFLTFIYPHPQRALGVPTFIFKVIGLYLLISFGVNNWLLMETQNKAEHEVREEFDRRWSRMLK